MVGEGAVGQIPVSYIQQTPGGQFVPDNRWYASPLISHSSLPYLSLISHSSLHSSHSSLTQLSLISPSSLHSSLTHLSLISPLISHSSLPHLSLISPLISPLISLISPSSLEQLSLIVVPALFLHCRSTVQPLELAQDPRRGM